ncbi:MAG: hypothetical protein KGN78_10200 [Actinomycetales bacterium]|nr:hypothetical protein [Actinomycetales bacterium]
MSADETNFLTGDDANFQLGVITRVAGSSIIPHVHFPVNRNVQGTSEALLVVSGKLTVDLYSSDKQYLESFSAIAGDVIVFVRGGHGFRFDQDTRLIEIKQGPFVEGADKEKFHRGVEQP